MYRTEALEKEQADPESKVAVAAGLVKRYIQESASVVLDQKKYEKRFCALSAKLDAVKAKLNAVTAQISDNATCRKGME